MKTILSCPRGSFDLWFSKAQSVLISFERACVTLSSFPIINQSLTQRNKKFTKSRRASSLGISEEYKTAFPPCKESGPFPYISLKQHLTTHVQFLQLSPHSPSPWNLPLNDCEFMHLDHYFENTRRLWKVLHRHNPERTQVIKNTISSWE